MRRWILLATTLLLAPIGATAYIDGDLDTTSAGEIGVSVALEREAPKIKISGLGDISFERTMDQSVQSNQMIEACIFMTQAGTYSVNVKAHPLIEGSVHYPYALRIDPGVSSLATFDQTITDTMIEGTISGLTPSYAENCGFDILKFVFVDEGADVTEPITASARVEIIVSPDS